MDQNEKEQPCKGYPGAEYGGCRSSSWLPTAIFFYPEIIIEKKTRTSTEKEPGDDRPMVDSLQHLWSNGGGLGQNASTTPEKNMKMG